MVELTTHGLAMLVFSGLVFGLFVLNRWSISTVSLGILAALTLGFTLLPFVAPGQAEAVRASRFLTGFASPPLVAICALMIVGHALVVTGALQPAARKLANMVAKHPRAALLLVLGLGASVSGVINDTPVVVPSSPCSWRQPTKPKCPRQSFCCP